MSPAGGPVTPPPDASEVAELQKTLISLQNTADEREKQLAELSASLEEAKQKESSLLLERDEVQQENGVLLENYTRLQASVTELQTRVQEQEEKSLQKAQLDHEIQELRKCLEGIVIGLFMFCFLCYEFMFYRMIFISIQLKSEQTLCFLALEKENARLTSLSSVSVNSGLNHYYHLQFVSAVF